MDQNDAVLGDRLTRETMFEDRQHRPRVTVTRAHMSPRGFAAPLPRRRRDESLHADFDLRLLGKAFAAMGHNLVDIPRGLAEKAGDVSGDGFVLVRERGQGFQVMA